MFTNSFKVLSISFIVFHSSGLMADSQWVLSPVLTAQAQSQRFMLDQVCPNNWSAWAGNVDCVGSNYCGSITIKISHDGGDKNIATYYLTNPQDSSKTFQLTYQCFPQS